MGTFKQKKKKKKQGPNKPLVNPEYVWLNQINKAGDPSNPEAYPFDASQMSAFPESTLAINWINKNCRFAKHLS